MDEVKRYLIQHDSASVDELSDALNIAESSIRSILTEMMLPKNNLVEVYRVGKRKRYRSITKRQTSLDI